MTGAELARLSKMAETKPRITSLRDLRHGAKVLGASMQSLDFLHVSADLEVEELTSVYYSTRYELWACIRTATMHVRGATCDNVAWRMVS
jgi:hypothetical protein